MSTPLNGPDRQTRRWSWFLMATLAVMILSSSMPRMSLAQDAADAPAAAADTAEEQTPAQKVERRNLLAWMIDASGIFGFLLLLMSFVMVALIVMNWLQVRRETLLPPGFIEEFEQRLGQKDFQGAYEIARGDESFIARVVTAGLGKLSKGRKEALDSMQEAGDQETMDMEHRLSYLALIGSLAPMIGLMGTVWGMIATFRVIANSDTSPKPRDLADGISTALFTTLEGLAVAIPAMVAYLVLRNRMVQLSSEVGMVSEGLLSPLSNIKKPGGAAPTTAPASPQS